MNASRRTVRPVWVCGFEGEPEGADGWGELAKNVKEGVNTKRVMQGFEEEFERVFEDDADDGEREEDPDREMGTRKAKNMMEDRRRRAGAALRREEDHVCRDQRRRRDGSDLPGHGRQKPLLAVRRLVERGSSVSFGPPPEDNYIINKRAGVVIPMEKRGGSFVSKAHFMKEINKEASVFTGQVR